MTGTQIRYSLHYALGVVPGKPWAVRDHALGRVAQTAGLMAPRAYFKTEEEARAWTDDMNAQHRAGTAPPYEVEEYRGGSAEGYLRHSQNSKSSGVGEVRFVTPPPLWWQE